MNVLLDIRPFKSLHPEQDARLFEYFVEPEPLAEVLDAQSMVLSAPSGYGKTTLAYVAQRLTDQTWLNVTLKFEEPYWEDYMNFLLRQITGGIWEYLETNPDKVRQLEVRAEAVKYFLNRYSGIDIDYQLACLAEDFPEHAPDIRRLIDQEPRELFGPMATNTQRLSILCDCVQKFGLQGVVVWFDLSSELSEIPDTVRGYIQDFFDSLALMRRRTLYFKCFAPPSVCAFLSELRGVQTLSVAMVELNWPPARLRMMLNRRLQAASRGQFADLAVLVEANQFESFLDEFSDIHSPVEWLALCRLVVETVNEHGEAPLSTAHWLSVRRAYFAERLKIRLDAEGHFWRGKHLLHDLTRNKRAIYPLVKYLYENPGFHRTYRLAAALNTDDNTLNTTISRARKDHLEPDLGGATGAEESFIYLVTDFKGGGYALLHTDRLS
jgi:hypothetical protein